MVHFPWSGMLACNLDSCMFIIFFVTVLLKTELVWDKPQKSCQTVKINASISVNEFSFFSMNEHRLYALIVFNDIHYTNNNEIWHNYCFKNWVQEIAPVMMKYEWRSEMLYFMHGSLPQGFSKHSDSIINIR